MKVEIVGKGYAKESVEELNEMFDYYNEKLFNNELKKIPVTWNNRITSTFGYISYEEESYEPLKIDLSKKYHSLNTKEELSNTLIHEMIHIKHVGHGKGFQQEAKRVSKLTGLNIGTYGGELDRVPYFKYTVLCMDCGNITYHNKDVTTAYRCGECYGELYNLEER